VVPGAQSVLTLGFDLVYIDARAVERTNEVLEHSMATGPVRCFAFETWHREVTVVILRNRINRNPVMIVVSGVLVPNDDAGSQGQLPTDC